ncbi:MAG: zinc ribbon domain-containing protein [Draconibacterium sp.]|nr:zinc ribbon domain-containing protein [Draconibacterium sp.]
MAFCVHCGYDIPAGTRFCSSCGKEQNISTSECSKCGKILEENEKFCSSCGTPVIRDSGKTKVKNTEQKPLVKKENRTKEGRKIIDGGPKPEQHKQVSPPSPPVSPTSKKKKKGCMGCLGKSLLIILVVLIIGVVVIWNLPDDETDTSASTENVSPGGKPTNPETNKVFKQKPNDVKVVSVDAENTVAVAGKVKVYFGSFNINETKEVSIQQYPDNIIDNECKIVAYEIDLKGKSKFDDYLTISLPYDDSFIEKGDANNCVVAQYFNEESKNWESVLFTIDTKNKVVNIETDHLSKYGIFTVKNETKRRAYISGFYIPNNYFTRDKTELHLEVIDKYYSDGRSLGEEALSKGLSFWGEFSGKSGAAVNTLTLGGMYSTKLINKLNDGFKNAGYVASTVQLAYDLWRGDQKSAAINLTKNLMNQIVAELNITSLNLAFVGVYFIDYSLTKFGNAAMASRYEELFKVYNYYNKTQNSHRRTLKEWRAFFIETEKENQKNPQQASDLIMEEIDAYSREFIDKLGLGTDNENTMEFNALAGEAGVKSVAWPNPDDVSKIQQEGKQQLIDKLYPVFASLNHFRINKMKEELIKECNELQKTMNTVVPITIMEDLEKGKKPEYANHIVCIRPLNSDTDKKQWTGRLDKKGFIKTSFSILGFVLAGEPNKVEIYDPEDIPDDDDPILVKEFVVNEKGIVVIIGEGADELEDPYKKFDEKIFNYDYSKLYYEISDNDEREVIYRNSETEELEGMSIRFWDKERKKPQSILYYMTGEYKNLFKQGKLGKGIEMMMREPGIGAFPMYSTTGEKEQTGLISTHKEGYSVVDTFLGKWRKTVNTSINGKIREVSYIDINDRGSYCFRKDFYNNNEVKIKQEEYREDGSLSNQIIYNSDGSKKSSKYFSKDE